MTTTGALRVQLALAAEPGCADMSCGPKHAGEL